MTDKSAILKTKGVEAVDKALRILTLFDSQSPVLSLHDISQRTGLVKSSTLRLLVSLQSAGLLATTPDRRYTIGIEAFRIGRVYQRTFRLDTVIRPALKKLVQATGESGSFFRREGDQRVCLFREDTNEPLREHIAEGDSVPIGRGAAGRVFLHFSDHDGMGPASHDELSLLPVMTIGERGPDIAGMSVPIFAIDQGMIGALTLSGPSTRFTEERVSAMKPLLVRAAADICYNLRSPFYELLG
ncbi:IclR family transcriptional regulator [Rhizobium rhizogenes]|uniref:IclR family transcriptional regulator n=1 Tax=Rhizobium rhizogenes TaxID=359 RepID=UPI00068A96BE|nr:IclR family transcriptional regulator [Rhizobium rhizogenes]